MSSNNIKYFHIDSFNELINTKWLGPSNTVSATHTTGVYSLCKLALIVVVGMRSQSSMRDT